MRGPTTMVWFVKDFCGIICAMFTWLLMAFSQFVVLFIILLPQKDTTSKYVNLVIFELFSFLSLASHLRTMLTNPGAVPRGTATREAIQELGMTEGQNVLIIVPFANDVSEKWIIIVLDCPGTNPGKSAYPSPVNLILMIFLVFEALLFAIFTVIMFLFQIKAIWNDETGIENLKKESGRSKRGSFHNFTSVFGKDFLKIFSPFSRSIGGFLEVPFYSCQV
ncbi:Palmitoyltransferase ZDHHC3 [Fragariocoptes setiger]|uniref:Palmitoyltransferase ZDHHC3 n=1 Tax=Fragariocoptes setiger TaxID=1670756 RepID=A0ABQ7SC10_9ACAR|nr:Palmitoyltransferase ZDHHC3 [Fragariocoptes setiger]